MVFSGFNPRPHAEGDPLRIAEIVLIYLFQSTPSRGGRRSFQLTLSAVFRFQSTPSRGGRRPSLCFILPRSCFNPRPHAEGDGSTSRWQYRNGGFNPCPHAEGDPICRRHSIPYCAVSIHALTRRATPLYLGSGGCRKVSIHALTRRATVDRRHVSSANKSFNPRPHAEGDALHVGSTLAVIEFQSTPSRGGRRAVNFGKLYRVQFQSTPSRGGRPDSMNQ